MAFRRACPHTMRNSALHFIAHFAPHSCSEHSHGIFHTTITPRWVSVRTAAWAVQSCEARPSWYCQADGKRASGLRPEDSRGRLSRYRHTATAECRAS